MQRSNESHQPTSSPSAFSLKVIHTPSSLAFGLKVIPSQKVEGGDSETAKTPYSYCNNKGELRIANISTGRYLKYVCRIGGNILSIAFDTNGKFLWAGNDRGEIVSVFCELNEALCKMKKFSLASHCSITSLSYRAWISREARDPLLLVNATDNSMYLLSITDCEGGLQLKRKFQNRHQKHIVRSTFCPIMSFRQGACVVTGSEDGSIYFVDIEKMGNRSVVNTLQGHSSSVLSISFNYDESFLATSDLQGLVIIWKKGNMSQ
ncbi:WD repeat-containing protein 13-like [Anoplophora glabripennis]|uniref:WD repeat-containing protein 13-like n=1 Tax=Anoplophora glabripennis TaxID=217634 RepID=UPI000C77B006|nr:WD repeat-containing protein 13-like [Anoplophora glabripennis]